MVRRTDKMIKKLNKQRQSLKDKEKHSKKLSENGIKMLVDRTRSIKK
jgi:hypothetical protein